MAKVSDFRQKEVINIHDGKRLGFVYDVEFNLSTGRLEAVVVPNGKFMSFLSKDHDYVIPWEKIHKIGDDIILVDYDT